MGENKLPIHKAAPGDDEFHCATCGQRIQRVPGGQGSTYVHADSGTVAAPNPPKAGRLTWAELMASGKRSVRKGECTEVVVAPDHTGEDNYHTCSDSVNHGAGIVGPLHYCGCGYTWKGTGEIVERPEWAK